MAAGVPSLKLSNSKLPDRVNYTTEASLWVEHIWIQFHMVFTLEAGRGPNQGLHTHLSPKVKVVCCKVRRTKGGN